MAGIGCGIMLLPRPWHSTIPSIEDGTASALESGPATGDG